MSRDNDLCDWSRASLEAAADHLRLCIAAGEDHLRPRLDAVLAALPDALEYTIDHRDRDCRGRD